MKLSWVLIVSLAIAGAGVEESSALNAPRTVHHSRSQHIVQSHRTAHHASHAPAKAGPSTQPAVAHHSAKAANGASTIRRATLRTRHHHSYTRFPPHSF